jgi:uncharacterized protein
MAAKYELKPTKNGQFIFNLKAANGEVILSSEVYTTKASALGGIESCKKNSCMDERYEKKTASSGQFYFVLKTANAQTIGKSEMYESQAGCVKGIDSVKRNGPEAEVVELASA